jgi:hypothetical protein
MRRPETAEEVLAFLENCVHKIEFQDFNGPLLRSKNRVLLSYRPASGIVATVGGRNVREAVLKAAIRREFTR